MSLFNSIISVANAAEPAGGSALSAGTATPTTAAAVVGASPDAAGAAVAPAVAEPSILVRLLPLLLIVVVFYILLIRPQQKRMAMQDAMLKALKVGDKVVTNGGMLGHIVKFEGDDIVVLDVTDGVKIRVLRSTISGIYQPKPTSAETVKSKAEVLPPANDKNAKSSGKSKK